MHPGSSGSIRILPAWISSRIERSLRIIAACAPYDRSVGTQHVVRDAPASRRTDARLTLCALLVVEHSGFPVTERGGNPPACRRRCLENRPADPAGPGYPARRKQTCESRYVHTKCTTRAINLRIEDRRKGLERCKKWWHGTFCDRPTSMK